MKKTIYIIIGAISLVLGVVGIFVPGLPTTPFVLLSSWLFYRSNSKLHNWLLNSRMGVYINRYEKRGGMGRRTKIISICLMWIMINISAFLFFETLKIRIILYVLGLIGSICVIFIVPAAKNDISK
ncbi:MAG: YbaN family protein [Rikenellaceae bacterium]